MNVYMLERIKRVVSPGNHKQYIEVSAPVMVAGYDEHTRERLRTLIQWEWDKKLHLFGLDYGDIEGVPSKAVAKKYPNAAGCWLRGNANIIFQEERYVFPSELVFAQIALAVNAGVADG